MDIYEYLKKDHEKVAKLFDLFKAAPSERNKLEIAEMISEELLIHADAESYIFYSALDLNKQAESEIAHSEYEHEEIKNKIAEVLLLKQVGFLLDSKLAELQALVEHHVSEEEGKIFRMAKKILSDENAMFLKEKMHDYKGQLRLKQNKIIEKVKKKEEELEVEI
jgi:hypothetical protein